MTHTQERPISVSSQESYIESWQTNKQGLEIDFAINIDKKDLKRINLPWMWLRDHCQCSDCFTSTAQRECDIFVGWENFSWQDVRVDTDIAGLNIRWQDNHSSHFSYSWLREILNVGKLVPVDERNYWINDFSSLDYHNVVDTDDGLRQLVECLTQIGVCKIVGAASNPTQAAQLMQRISYLRQSDLGDIVELKPSSNFNQNETHLHTAGAFNYDPPGIKLVQSLEESNSPCEITFIDGLELVNKIRHEAKQSLAALQNHEVSYQYVQQDLHLVASGPVITLENDHLRRIRYNPKRQISLAEGDPQKQQQLQAALQIFDQLIAAKSQQKTIRLQPRDIVLWDNWRVLHGGNALDGNHHLATCMVNMEDFHSRLRIARNQIFQRPVPKPRERRVTS